MPRRYGHYEEIWGCREWIPEDEVDEQENPNSDDAYDSKVEEKLINGE